MLHRPVEHVQLGVAFFLRLHGELGAQIHHVARRCLHCEPYRLVGPDGSIIFCSRRCHRYVVCWKTRVATLYRCNADRGSVRMLSYNAEEEKASRSMSRRRPPITR